MWNNLKGIKEDIKRDSIAYVNAFYPEDSEKDYRKGYMAGVIHVLNHYLFNAQSIWDSLDRFDKEELAEDIADSQYDEDCGYETIDDAWEDLNGNQQIEFLAEKLKEFYAWEIKRHLSKKQIEELVEF